MELTASLNLIKPIFSKAKYMSPSCKLTTIDELLLNNLEKTDKFYRCGTLSDGLKQYIKLLEEELFFSEANCVDKIPNGSSIILENLKTYPKVPHKQIGLLPYVGNFDLSWEMNRLLSGRMQSGTTFANHIKNFTEIMKYSLKDLDKEYGVYNGIVYRGGFFDPKVKQFYSTSFECCPELLLSDYKSFNLIKTTKGHKIYDFQKKHCTGMYRDNFLSEKEILLHDVNFVDGTGNAELEKARYEMATNLTEFSNNILQKPITLDEMISKIKIWQEC